MQNAKARQKDAQEEAHVVLMQIVLMTQASRVMMTTNSRVTASLVSLEMAKYARDVR